MTEARQRLVIHAASRPALGRHARLRHDAARDRWIILAPERVLELDSVALAVLQLCDGSRTVEEVAAELARSYLADRQQILADVMPMLQDMADKSLLTA